MKLQYICRYCKSPLGEIESTGLTEQQLGFDLLTEEERKDIITSNINGIQQVQIVCETCQQTLEKNPELHLLPQFYH